MHLKATLPSHALCVWTADLRYSVDLNSDSYVSINVTGGETGDIQVAGYTLNLTAGEKEILETQPKRLEKKGDDVYASGKMHRDFRCNYLVVLTT